jgi:hypothetical protein
MSSEVLVLQAALTNRDRWDATAVGDDVSISAQRPAAEIRYLVFRTRPEAIKLAP